MAAIEQGKFKISLWRKYRGIRCAAVLRSLADSRLGRGSHLVAQQAVRGETTEISARGNDLRAMDVAT